MFACVIHRAKDLQIENRLEPRMGANCVVNVRTAAAHLETFLQDGGYFDAAIEASGNIRAWKTASTQPGRADGLSRLEFSRRVTKEHPSTSY